MKMLISLGNGGVLARDLLAGFWIDAYAKFLFHDCHSNGTSPSRFFNLSSFRESFVPWLLSNWPNKIALPALIHMLLGSCVTVPLNILKEVFLDYLSVPE